MKISPFDYEIKKIRNLFYRGEEPYSLAKRSIAIAGSRRMTRYGKEVVDKFVSTFVSQGITTISGFMYGVDTEVHQKTVDYGGCTIAVFGCGLNVIYPPENEKLYKEILENGGSVISEYEKDAKPHLWKFPQRNKIVAGLSSLGVLVIEAGEKSGSLITAEFARRMKKKVYAVPGPITSSVSVGCNELIRNRKAELVIDPYQILNIKNKKVKMQIKDQRDLDPLEEKISRALQNEGLTIDELSVSLDESVVEVGKTTSLMSIKGLLTESGGKYYLGK